MYLKFRFNADKCCLWGCFSVFVLIVVIIASIALYVLVGIPFIREHGIGTKATREKCSLALREWNPPELIHWAHRYISYAKKSKYPLNNLGNGYYYLAQGYEMNGNCEEALETYRTMQEIWPNEPLCFKQRGRLQYRLGNREEAFKMFCQYINLLEISYDRHPRSSRGTLQEWLDRAIRRIPFIDGDVEPSKQRSVSPFKSYQEFLDFMEEEYAKQEDQAPYQEAMEIYREFSKKEGWG